MCTMTYGKPLMVLEYTEDVNELLHDTDIDMIVVCTTHHFIINMLKWF